MKILLNNFDKYHNFICYRVNMKQSQFMSTSSHAASTPSLISRTGRRKGCVFENSSSSPKLCELHKNTNEVLFNLQVRHLRTSYECNFKNSSNDEFGKIIVFKYDLLYVTSLKQHVHFLVYTSKITMLCYNRI